MGATPSVPAQPANADAVAPLSKVNYQTLYRFKGQPDGDTPNPDLIEATVALYGYDRIRRNRQLRQHLQNYDRRQRSANL